VDADKNEQHQAAQHGHSLTEHRLHKWLLGGAAVAGSIISAPYILPLLNIGDPVTLAGGETQNIMGQLADPTFSGASGSGFAHSMHNALGEIPLIGSALTSNTLVSIPGIGVEVASGALVSLGVAAGLSVGGIFLSRYLEKREDPNAKIKWSKVVRYACMATSMLITLPSLMTGLSVGIAFVASQFGLKASIAATEMLSNTLGATSMASSVAGGASSIAALLPHVFTCGLAALPVLGTLFVGKKKSGAHEAHAKADPEEAPLIALHTSEPVEAGKPITLQFSLRDQKSGRPLTPSDIRTTHTEKLHTMVVNSSLTDYHHIHPRYNNQTRTWDATITPKTNERYTSWHDLTKAGEHAPHHVSLALPAGQKARNIPASIMHQRQAQADGVRMTWDIKDGMQQGKASTLYVTMHDANGAPITSFSPIMGADAHLVGFSKDGSHFVHCHPTRTEGHVLQFHIQPEHAGHTRFFLQARPNGTDVTIPVGQYIQPNIRAAHASHASHTEKLPHAVGAQQTR
jgi:hypothetical protein